MKISNKQGLIMGTILHYGGKALIAMGACFLPWPYACVAWGWIIANTGMTVALNAKGFGYKDKLEDLKNAAYLMTGIIDQSDGVYGYHLNGDPSPWSEFEDEVKALSDAYWRAQT